MASAIVSSIATILPATFAPLTPTPASRSGASTRFRKLANSATTPGEKIPGNSPDTPTSGRPCRSMNAAACSIFPSARRAMISTAAIAPAIICSPIRSFAWTLLPARANGITSSCITACGITTCPRRRAWSLLPWMAARLTPSSSSPSKASHSCSIASRVYRCGRSRSAPSRLAMSKANTPHRRSLFPPSRPRSARRA